jgi:hypothetical protein
LAKVSGAPVAVAESPEPFIEAKGREFKGCRK